MEKVFRFIARALIVDDGKILIARLKGAHSFFPGGGVEIGEGCEAALKRELREELGVKDCKVGRFLGVLESSFVQPDGGLLHEVSHWFEVCSSELTSMEPPISQEDHLEFYWIDEGIESLRAHNVLPEAILEYIPEMLHGEKPLRVSTLD